MERVEACELNNINSMVAMELYLGSVIEPIRKSIHNTLYWNSQHAPKTLGEVIPKAQDLHIKHLCATGENKQHKQPNRSSDDLLPEITVNKFNSRENQSWYPRRYRHEHEGMNI